MTTHTPSKAPEPKTVLPHRFWRLGVACCVFLTLLAGALVSQVARKAGNDAIPGTLRGRAAWIVLATVTSIVLLLLLRGLIGANPYRYPAEERRDLRIDMIRGLAITFVVLNHINIPSLFQIFSQEAIGPVSGAELFVSLSGVVLGIVYRERARTTDMMAVAGALWSRSIKLYRTALVVVLSIFVLTLLPGVDGRVVTTFTDQGNGQTYGLYPNIERLLDYPVPGYVLRDVLFLRLGPYQFNIMGLYVVLLAVSPLLIVALRRRLTFLLLGLSWLLYLFNTVIPTHLLVSQFEDPFPLLTWQLLFTHGLAAGWHRDRLLRWARTGWGRAALIVMVTAQLVVMFFSWNNPYLSNAYDVRLGLIPDQTFTAVYAHWFLRQTLGLGRVIDVGLVLVAIFALLTAYWQPIRRAVGWFFIPLGQATLYVFVIHVYFSLLVGNLAGIGGESVIRNTFVHAAILMLLWVMVKKRFLFGFIPR